MDVKKFIGFAIGPVLSGGLGIVTLPLMAWTFSAADIGRLSMLQLVSTLSVVVFSLGMDQAYVRDFHEVGENAKPDLLIAAALPGFVTCLVMIGVLMTFSPHLPALLVFDLPSIHWSESLMVAVVVALISRFLSLVLRMREQGFAFSMSQSAPKLLFLLALVGAWAAHWNSFDFLLLSQISTLAVVLAAYAYSTRNEWIPGLAAPFDWQSMRRMFRFGIPLVPGGLASWAVMTLDKMLLRNLSTMDELGVYSVAASLASSVGVATVLFTTIWVPTVYRWHAQGDAWPRVQKATSHVTAACCLVLSVAGLLSPLVAHLLPARYAQISQLIPACMTLPVFYALSEATAVGLGIGRKSIYSMWASLIAALSGLLLGTLLVSKFGARGASIAAALVATVFVVARTEFAGMAWRPMLRARIYSTVFVLAILVCGYAASDSRLIEYWIVVWAMVLLGAIWFFRENVVLGVTLLWNLLARGRGPGNAY